MITGASSGIGRATALAFAARGDQVVGVARRSDRLASLADEIEALPGEFLALTGDVTDTASMQQAVAQTIERFGRLDVLVANAGIGLRGGIADAEWEHIEKLLRTNIDGVLHSIRAAVPAMRRQGSGHIISISSVTFNLISPYAALYAASKAFVSSASRALRYELAADDIAVTDVLVGRTHTEFNEKRLGAGKRTGRGVPTMPPERVAQAIVRATERRPKTVVLRLFDRLIVWANALMPRFMASMALRQYR